MNPNALVLKSPSRTYEQQDHNRDREVKLDKEEQRNRL